MERFENGGDMTGFRSLNNSTSKRVLNLLEPVKLTVWEVMIERVTVVKFRVNYGGGNGSRVFKGTLTQMIDDPSTCQLSYRPCQPVNYVIIAKPHIPLYSRLSVKAQMCIYYYCYCVTPQISETAHRTLGLACGFGTVGLQ